MKTISLWQPWATLVVIGAKRFETRSWATSYTGPLAIHASKRFQRAERELCATEPFARALAAAGYRTARDLPLGGVVGTTRLKGCHRIPADPTADRQECETFTGCACPAYRPRSNPVERAFGDWRPGRWAWDLTDAFRLGVFVEWSGSQGFFDVPDHLLGGEAPPPAAPFADAPLFAATGGAR